MQIPCCMVSITSALPRFLYRRKVLVDAISERLKELIKEKCSEIKMTSGHYADIIEMEILPDHVHLLIEVDPQYGVNKAIKLIKGYTSYMLRKEFVELPTKLPTLWSNSYFISTVGGAPLTVIKQYIESQARSQREEGKKNDLRKSFNAINKATENQ